MLPPEQLADHLSARQHGLILRRQALAAGLTARQIDHRIAFGRWRPAGRGVYAVAAVPVSWRQTVLAACLSRPDRAVASHLTAAALHGLARPPTVPHITVPAGASRSPLAMVHRAALHQRDRVVIDAIPATGVARTLIDCAGVVSDAKLAGIVDVALCARLSHPNDLAAAITRAQAGRGKPGVARLRRALDAWSSNISPGSPAELRLLRLVAQWGLPTPEMQIELRDGDGRFVGRIDMGWSASRLGLEYDGELVHNPRHWEHDERRQRAYAELGWDVRRVDKYDLRAGQSRLRDDLEARVGRRAA